MPLADIAAIFRRFRLPIAAMIAPDYSFSTPSMLFDLRCAAFDGRR
jgi:hypothetical protein